MELDLIWFGLDRGVKSAPIGNDDGACLLRPLPLLLLLPLLPLLLIIYLFINVNSTYSSLGTLLCSALPLLYINSHIHYSFIQSTRNLGTLYPVQYLSSVVLYVL